MASQAVASDLDFCTTAPATVSTSVGSVTGPLVVPDYVVPQNALRAGSKLRATIYGNYSGAANNPLSFAAYWGGSGGVQLVTGSVTFQLQRNANGFSLEMFIVCLSLGTLLTTGIFRCLGYATAATGQGFALFPAGGGVPVSGLDFSTPKALNFSATVTSVGAVAANITTNLFALESVGL